MWFREPVEYVDPFDVESNTNLSDAQAARRGPYDTLYGWRAMHVYDPVPGNGLREYATSGYNTVGPYGYLIQRMRSSLGGHHWEDNSLSGETWQNDDIDSRFRNSQLTLRIGLMGAIKTQYMWPNVFITRNNQVRSYDNTILIPDWESNYEQAEQRNQTDRIAYTLWAHVIYYEHLIDDVSQSNGMQMLVQPDQQMLPGDGHWRDGWLDKQNANRMTPRGGRRKSRRSYLGTTARSH